jgi:hypothetical protein
MDQDELGRRTEALIQAQIEASGWYHEPVADYQDGEAPMLRAGRGDDRIRPDFRVSKGGETVWIDAKGKTERTSYEGQPRHGIEHYNWTEYNRVADATDDQCWLFIYEERTGLLLCQDIAQLPVADDRIKDHYPPNDPYGSDMVFFNVNEFNIKHIQAGEYPEKFFGQNKLPLENITGDEHVPLFPGGPGDTGRDVEHASIIEFAGVGGGE